MVTTTALSPRETALRVISQLPPFSPILTKLMGSLANDNVSFAELGDLIEKDAVLAGNVLRLVNSAFYARRGTISSARHAVSILGLSKLRNIAMSLSVARMWNQQKWPQGWVPSHFNKHSVAAATLADLIAAEVRVAFPEGAFTASLLQNTGMLLIAMGLPDEHHKIRDLHVSAGQPIEACEHQVLGTNHAELGAETCESWGLPQPIMVAVRDHHTDRDPARPTLASVVGAADIAVGRLGIMVQEWCAPDAGDPAEALAIAGIGVRAQNVLDAFKAEYEAVKGFFQ